MVAELAWKAGGANASGFDSSSFRHANVAVTRFRPGATTTVGRVDGAGLILPSLRTASPCASGEARFSRRVAHWAQGQHYASALMILATDVHYTGDEAITGAVLFEDWRSGERLHEWADSRTGVEAYAAGEFFRRELPCILPLIQRAYQSLHLKTIIVDGYVDLGDGKPGLGRYLQRALDGRVEVVGVAKNEFVGAPAAEVLRGKSAKPLFVTSTGDVNSAARRIASMAGEHRLPEILRRVDELSRGARPKR